jgi:hypothetical protein
VDCVNLSTVNGSFLNGFEVIISTSVESAMLRQAGVTRPLVLWTGHDINQPAVQKLRDGAERWLWDRVVCVSNWQAKRYIDNVRTQIRSDQRLT